MLDIAIWTVLTLFVLTLIAATVGIPVPRTWARAHANRSRALANRPRTCIIRGCTYGGDKLIAMARPDGIVGAACGRCADVLETVDGWERLASRHARTSA